MRPIYCRPLLVLLFCLISFNLHSDQRDNIYRIGGELEEQVFYLAQSNYDHFKGWDGALSDKEQEVLFKSEAFLASCRLFLRITGESTDYFRSGYLRTNLPC